MIDYHTSLVSALSSILPTYYEMNLTEGIETPCISYYERNNYHTALGDTLGYSSISYYVKVWGHSIKDLQENALLIDNALRPIGFRRTSSGEVFDINSTMIQKIMVYDALFVEQFDDDNDEETIDNENLDEEIIDNENLPQEVEL